MDWDKANFQKINQRRAESKRWEQRDAEATKRGSTKANNRPPSKKKKRGKG
ncbi:MAG: hypothetical protein ACNA77_09040 [Opitutales bacterium]